MTVEMTGAQRGRAALLTALALPFLPAAAGAEPLRVCADPNNLPFSNRAEEGFENELARFVAGRLGADSVEYTWRPQRRGFVRNTLNAGDCDLIMGVPANYELAETTPPYYRSSYVFVYREDAPFEIENLDDPDLRRLRVGVPVVGDDYSHTPGSAALARRGIADNVVGYSIYGDYSKPHPPSRLIEAVAEGEIDLAIAWGPLAGYFANLQEGALRVEPVTPQMDGPGISFTFSVAMATRPGDQALREKLEQIIETDGAEINALLKSYGVPLLGLPAASEQPEAGREAYLESPE